jgi:hypothetical protein
LNNKINVVCVLREGGKVGYDSSWVEKLMNGIERNLTVPYQFCCLSDCNVPCNRIPLEDLGTGFWSKLQLFRPKLFNGPVLYIDLDTVICSDITPIIDNIQNEKFVMFYETDTNIHSSAIMYWNGDYSFLWDLYKSKDLNYWKTLYSKPPLYGDQALISENVEHTLIQNFCPNEWFHLASKKDKNITNFEKIKFLMFRKPSQKPSSMIGHPLVIKHWK